MAAHFFDTAHHNTEWYIVVPIKMNGIAMHRCVVACIRVTTAHHNAKLCFFSPIVGLRFRDISWCLL